MSGVVVVALVLIVMVVVVVVRHRATHAGGRQPDAVGLGPARWRALGLAMGLIAGVLMLNDGGLGRGPLLAAPAFGLCVLVGVIVGELLITAPGGPIRHATLEVRRIRDYLPRRLTTVVTATTALLGGILVATTLAGSADDQGRAGRSLARQCSAIMGEATGPWPGSYYSVPLALAVGLGLLGAALASRVIVRRPRPGGDRADDDAARCRAVSAVVAASGVLVAVPLIGVSLTAAGALFRISCRPEWWNTLAWSLLLLAVALVILLGWCAASLLPPISGLARARAASLPTR
ncbi:MAG: hypothetical protein ABI181_06145 [Mycobacteriaceae bacterium]